MTFWLFCLRHWKALVLIAVQCVALGWAFHIGAKSREVDVLKAQQSAQGCQVALDMLRNQLADAEKASKQARQDAKDAAEAAQKRLRERERYWKDLYAHDPESRAWAEQRVPGAVLDGLRR